MGNLMCVELIYTWNIPIILEQKQIDNSIKGVCEQEEEDGERNNTCGTRLYRFTLSLVVYISPSLSGAAGMPGTADSCMALQHTLTGCREINGSSSSTRSRRSGRFVSSFFFLLLLFRIRTRLSHLFFFSFYFFFRLPLICYAVAHTYTVVAVPLRSCFPLWKEGPPVWNRETLCFFFFFFFLFFFFV